MVREPLADDEPVMIAVAGPYAFGYLCGESGHHRLREGERTHVAKVTVAARAGRSGEVTLGKQKTLKQVGQYGGAVRSRVEVAGSELVVQTACSVPESRELALELAPAWPGPAAGAEQAVVRRYELAPFLLRDFRTGTKSGRADTLHPGPFHQLLCKRIDSA
jgi:hypothetical protein